MLSQAKIKTATIQAIVTLLRDNLVWHDRLKQEVNNRLLDDHNEEMTEDEETGLVYDTAGVVARRINRTLKPGDRV